MAFRFNKYLNGERITRKRFKNEDDYMDAIFAANQQAISEAFGVNAREKFKQRAGFFKEAFATESLPTVLKGLEKTELFRGAQERLSDNMRKSLQENELWGKFRQMTRNPTTGRFEAYNPDLWQAVGDNTFIYNNKVKYSWGYTSTKNVSLEFIEE